MKKYFTSLRVLNHKNKALKGIKAYVLLTLKSFSLFCVCGFVVPISLKSARWLLSNYLSWGKIRHKVYSEGDWIRYVHGRGGREKSSIKRKKDKRKLIELFTVIGGKRLCAFCFLLYAFILKTYLQRATYYFKNRKQLMDIIIFLQWGRITVASKSALVIS